MRDPTLSVSTVDATHQQGQVAEQSQLGEEEEEEEEEIKNASSENQDNITGPAADNPLPETEDLSSDGKSWNLVGVTMGAVLSVCVMIGIVYGHRYRLRMRE